MSGENPAIGSLSFRELQANRHLIPPMLRVACVESEHVGGIIGIVGSALPVLYQPGQPGFARIANEVLTGIEQYLRNCGVIYKVPVHTKRPITEEQLDRLKRNIDHLIKVYGVLPPAQRHTFRGVGNLLDDIQAAYTSPLEHLPNTMVASVHPDLSKRYKPEQVIEAQDELVDGILRMNTEGNDEREKMALPFPHVVLEKLAAISAGKPHPQFDYYAIRRAGISLDALFREDDEEQFINNAVRHIGATPVGDCFAQRIIEGIFFTSTRRVRMWKTEAREDVSKTESIEALHQTVAEQIFMEALGLGPADQHADQRLLKMFQSLDSRNQGMFARLMFDTLLKGMQWHGVFEEARTEELGVASEIHTALYEASPDKLIRTDRVLFDLIRERLPMIRTRLEARFGRAHRFHEFLEAFGAAVEECDYDGELHAKLVTYLKTVEKTVARYKDELHITPLMVDEALVQRTLRYLSAPFREESLPRAMLGFTGVRFERSAVPGMRYRFYIHTIDPFLSIDGAMNDDGEIVGYPNADGEHDPIVESVIRTALMGCLSEVEETWNAMQPEPVAGRNVVKEAHSALEQFLKGEVE